MKEQRILAGYFLQDYMREGGKEDAIWISPPSGAQLSGGADTALKFFTLAGPPLPCSSGSVVPNNRRHASRRVKGVLGGSGTCERRSPLLVRRVPPPLPWRSGDFARFGRSTLPLDRRCSRWPASAFMPERGRRGGGARRRRLALDLLDASAAETGRGSSAASPRPP